MTVVRLGPLTVFFAKSRRIKVGAPISKGVPVTHPWSAVQSIACTDAQINGLLPSKSAAYAGGTAHAHAQISTAIRHLFVVMLPSSFDRIAAAFHARTEGPVVGIDLLLSCVDVLLLRSGLVLPGVPPADHRPCHGTDAGALPGIAGNGANRCAAQRTARSASHTFAASNRGPARWRWRRGQCRRIDPRALLGPTHALAFIALLLLRRLPFGRVDNRLLRKRHWCDRQGGQCIQRLPVSNALHANLL
jgi:hypothetical protein